MSSEQGSLSTLLGIIQKLPILVHGTLGWMVESSSLSVLNSHNVVDSTLCFVRTADDVERATSLRTDASIMVGVRMLVLIRSSTPETFPDTSMSLSLWRLHFVLAS